MLILPRHQHPHHPWSGGIHGLLVLSLLSLFAVTGNYLSLTSSALAVELPQKTSGEMLFTDKVQPILVRHCYSCHSHASGKMRGGLALDSRSGWEKGGDSGPALIPGRPEKSLLIQAIHHSKADLKMPPKEKLSEAEQKILVEWVKQGAPDPRVLVKKEVGTWWSLKPLVRPTPPENPSTSGTGSAVQVSTNPIDLFIRARLSLSGKGLSAAPEADRRTLIRRLTFNLHGLPPTPEEVDVFVNSQDPLAYDKLVDRLLASPRYGERWARHWLDVVRYGDSNGNEHDGFREHAWRYRDYVIRAFNRDTPYDRFIQEQLAADVLFREDPALIAALGFLAAGPDVLSGTDYIIRDEFVTTAMSAFTSTTAHCARCHAHKFDPISQEDYYALQAIFAGVQRRVASVDLDSATRVARNKWTTLKTAVLKREKAALVSDEMKAVLADWEQMRTDKGPRWQIQRPLATADTAILEQDQEGVFRAKIVALGKGNPTSATYRLTIPGPVNDLKLLRLELLTPTLPEGSERPVRPKGLKESKRGPGTSDGSFALNELEVYQYVSEKDKGKKVNIRSSLSDEVDVFRFAFRSKDKNPGYELSTKNTASTRTHDGKETSAWVGETGTSSTAIFELNSSLKVAKGGRLEILLKQPLDKQIGTFRLSVAEQPLSPYALVPRVVTKALAVLPQQRQESEWLALANHCLPILCDENLAQLREPTNYYIVAGKLPEEGAPALPKPVSILRRGEMGKPVGPATPGALSCVSGLEARLSATLAKDESARRAYLARWLSDRNNPLTWRSIVNRVWHYHFGRGIVETLNDFGQMGSLPTHPELLDWLACEFRDSRMSFKDLHRLIVTSATYRQAVVPNTQAEKMDQENQLLWRMNRNRLDAESYRDTVLAIAGRLDQQMGGPGVFQFEVKPGFNTTKLANYDAVDWDAPGVARRSIYRFIFRTRPDPFMAALDFPDASQFVPARAFSASALQALSLYNNHFVLHHSDRFARRLAFEVSDSNASNDNDSKIELKNLEAQLRLAFRLALQREPTLDETKPFVEYARRHGLAAACRVLLNSNEFLFVE